MFLAIYNSSLVDRVQTSYVTVEPKRRKQGQGGASGGQGDAPSPPAAAATTAAAGPSSEAASDQTGQGSSRQQKAAGGAGGRELRRARIVITVKRTESYERWLEENPLQAIIAGDGDDDEDAGNVSD